ncbi:hypothetical protein ACFDTO_30620 [Microbacteriaceae bacterium 4G12]
MRNQSKSSHQPGDDRFNTAGPTTDESTTNYVREKATSQPKGNSTLSGNENTSRKDSL